VAEKIRDILTAALQKQVEHMRYCMECEPEMLPVATAIMRTLLEHPMACGREFEGFRRSLDRITTGTPSPSAETVEHWIGVRWREAVRAVEEAAPSLH
jgi:hypothetical protein